MQFLLCRQDAVMVGNEIWQGRMRPAHLPLPCSAATAAWLRAYTMSSHGGDDGMTACSVSRNQRTRGVFCRPGR